MANIRDLRQRIQSVGNIQKITRAMEMVATTKLRRFQGRAVSAKDYTAGLSHLVRGLTGAVAGNTEAAGEAAPLFEPGNEAAPHAILFVGSDRGLCGAYNSNIQSRLDQEIRRSEGEHQLYVVGRKAIAHTSRMGYKVAAYFEDRNLEKLSFNDAAAISYQMVEGFRAGKISRVSLCYTRFASMIRFEPSFNPFLPILPPDDAVVDLGDTIFEPDGPSLVGRLVPRYLETAIYHALLESITSEYASRRMAMKNATDAAGDMKKSINRTYNKVRQQKITSEILEVVAGAEAL